MKKDDSTRFRRQSSSGTAESLEKIGFGWGQIKVLVAGGGCWLADGAELLLLSSLTKAVSSEWGLDKWQKGIITSVVFLGVLVGNISSGILGDMFGRRIPMLLSYFGICIMSLLSVLSSGFYSVAFFRFWVGYSFGIGQPAFNALVGETTPAAWRLTMNAFSQLLFSFGELYSAYLIWLQDPDMMELDWRKLICWGAAPSLVFLIIALFWLTESPSFLLVRGRVEEARCSMQSIAAANGCMEPIELTAPSSASTTQSSVLDMMGVVLGRRLLYSTVVVCVSVFTLNFLFYGGLYAFPQILPELKLSLSPCVNLMLGAVSEVPGYLLGITLGNMLSRKTCMLVYLLAVLISTLSFGFAGAWILRTELDRGVEVLLQVGMFGHKVFTAYGFLIVYVYSIEIYPTVVRATGGALCIAAGRLGSIFAPIVYQHMLYGTGSHTAFFSLTGGLCALNALLVLFLPYETKGKLLQDHLDDDESKPLAESDNVGK